MPRPLIALAAALLLPATATTQEYQVGLALARAAATYDWPSAGGTGFVPADKSSLTPNLFGDAQIPVLPIGRLFTVTGDLNLRWTFGDDVGEAGLGFGAARIQRDRYLGVHYLRHSPLNGDTKLGSDWNVGTQGMQVIYRVGKLRVDARRTARRADGQYDVTHYGLAVRYGHLGAEVMRWSHEYRGVLTSRDETDLTRVSVSWAMGQVGR